MASEPSPDGLGSILHHVGDAQDIYGEDIEFGVSGDEIHIDCVGGSIVLGPDEREQFMRVYMEAERRAEASA